MMPTIETMKEALRAARDPDNLYIYNDDGRRCFSGKVFDAGKARQSERADQIEALLMMATIRRMADA